MDPKARWEQEQINKLDGDILLDQLALAVHVVKPLHQIEAMEQILEEEQNTQQTPAI